MKFELKFMAWLVGCILIGMLFACAMPVGSWAMEWVEYFLDQHMPPK